LDNAERRAEAAESQLQSVRREVLEECKQAISNAPISLFDGHAYHSRVVVLIDALSPAGENTKPSTGQPLVSDNPSAISDVGQGAE